MIRRISAFAMGLSVSLLALNALAQDDGAAEAAPAEAAPAEASSGASASVSTDKMPASKGAFGKSGQIAISSDFHLGFSITSYKAPAGTDPESSTDIAIMPALDYFVADSISVGGQLGYASISQGDAKSSDIMIGPRVGYNLGFTDNLSFWPKLGIQYHMTSSKVTTPAGSSDASGSRLSLDVFAPVLFHPAEHFFIGLGPTFDMDLMSKVEGEDATKTTSFGLNSVVGGWF